MGGGARIVASGLGGSFLCRWSCTQAKPAECGTGTVARTELLNECKVSQQWRGCCINLQKTEAVARAASK